MFADFLQMAAAHCMVHVVPARNFTLPCVLLNETFLSPFSAGSWSGLRRELGASKIQPLMNEESFLCCLWNASNIDCSLYRASMQARKFIPSEINISAPQQIGGFSTQGHKKLILQKIFRFFCCLGGEGWVGFMGIHFYPGQATQCGKILPWCGKIFPQCGKFLPQNVVEDGRNCTAQFQKGKKSWLSFQGNCK